MLETVTAVRRTVEQVLRDRMPDAVVAAGTLITLPMTAPKTWHRLPDFTTIAEHLSPAVVVTTPQLRVGQRVEPTLYRCQFDVRVFAVIRGRDWSETSDRVGAYAAALRWCLLAEPDLRGLANGVDLTGENYAELASEDRRTVGACSVSVTYDGLLTVDLTAPADPAVADVAVTTTRLPAL